MAEKWCPGCRQNKDRDACFSRKRSTKDGYYGHCKVCKSERNRRWYHKNTETRRKANRLWYQKNKDRHAASGRRWAESNREKARASSRNWGRKNPAAVRRNSRKWLSNNPDRALTYVKRRQARLSSAQGFHSDAQWRARCELYGFRCFYCSVQLTPETLSKDHTKPLAAGGANWPCNLRPVCFPCNSSKSDRTPHAWEYRRGKLRDPSTPKWF